VAVEGTMRVQPSRSIVIPMVGVIGMLFILSYGESTAVLNAPQYGLKDFTRYESEKR
jgi:hypothetical protein